MNDAWIKKILKIIFAIAGAVIIFYFLYQLFDLLTILTISILAFIFNPFVTMLEREGFNRLTSTLITFVVVVFLCYLALSIFIPEFILQMNQLINTLNVYSLHNELISIEDKIHKYLPFFNPGDLSNRIERFISTGFVNSFDKIASVLTGIVSVVALVVIVPFITFFLLKDSHSLLHGILHIIPNKYFEMSYWILKKVAIQLGRFVRGWVFDATFVGVATGFGYYFLGVKNSLPLGLISGVGHLVPYLGPVIGMIPAIIISVIQYGNFSQVPFIIIMIIAVYAVDNGVVQPYVFAKSVDMHPIVIILLILAGGQLMGVIGMLIAVPLATVIKTLSKEIYYALKNYKIARL